MLLVEKYKEVKTSDHNAFHNRKFPQTYVDRRITRNGGPIYLFTIGKCECERKKCGHTNRYNKQLVFDNRGRDGRGKWEAHHKVAVSSGGDDSLSNCEILCYDCHKNTGTFGK